MEQKLGRGGEKIKQGRNWGRKVSSKIESKKIVEKE